MSQTDADELLAAVRSFLRNDLVPGLDGFEAYATRVAANSLAIVEREMRLRPELERLDDAACTAFGLDQEDEAVPRQLALRLRDGRFPVDDELLDYLRRRTLIALAIDNPRYSGYLQACERWVEPRVAWVRARPDPGSRSTNQQ